MITRHELISPQYAELQRLLHAEPRGYGGRGNKWAGIVLQLALQYEASSILDYGCGEGSLAAVLRSHPSYAFRIDEYDPGVPGKDGLPVFADMVVCTDVLEHVEPNRLDTVLAHLRLLARKVLWVVISTKTSNKVLADGRNAHLIVQPVDWWQHKLTTIGFTLHRAPTVVRAIPHKEWAVVLTP